MSEGRDPLTIRSFSTSSFWPKLVVLVLLLAFVGLSFYSVYAFRAMSAFRNQGLDQEIAKSEAIQKDRQFAALDERLTDLDYKLNELKVYEETLKVLAQDVNQRLGLPAGVDLSGVWPVLASSVAWTWGGLNGQGGQDNSLKDGQDPSLSQAPPNPAEIIKGLHQDLDRLEASAAAIDLAINELTTILEESRGLLAVTPYDLPMTTYRVTSTFGWRRPPLGGGGADFHQGLDLAAPTGTLVYAPADGVVLSADWSNNGYGLLVALDHGYGLTTRYAHLSASLVAPGQTVTRGEAIGRVGSTGRSTGPHLHYETILGGVHVDPLFFVPAAKNPLKEANAATENSLKGAFGQGSGSAKEPS